MMEGFLLCLLISRFLGVFSLFRGDTLEVEALRLSRVMVVNDIYIYIFLRVSLTRYGVERKEQNQTKSKRR